MPEATSTSVTTRSPEETRRLAERIGRGARGGEVICLSGPLGAGKTTFAKGLATGLGIEPRDVTSPTYLLVHEHAGRLSLSHLDAYRVRSSEELLELGVGEMLAGEGVVIIEWPLRVPELLPEDRLTIDLGAGDVEEERRIVLRAGGPRHAELLERVRREVGA